MAATTTSDTTMIRARMASGGLGVLYMVTHDGNEPAVLLYLYERLRPDFVNSYDNNSTTDPSPCEVEAWHPLLQEENALQEHVTRLVLRFTCASLVPTLLALFLLGSYSDAVGRRPLFLLPIVAIMIRTVITTTVILFNLDLNWFFLAGVLDGMSGSLAIFKMAALAYNADMTPPSQQRTSIIVMLEACMTLAGAAGRLVVGFIIQDFGFYIAAQTLTVLSMVNVILVFTVLPNTRDILQQTVDAKMLEKKIDIPEDSSAGQSSHSGDTLPESDRSRTGELYHDSQIRFTTPSYGNPFKYVKNIYVPLATMGERRLACLTLLCLTLAFVVDLGSFNIVMLYQINAPFCWDSAQVGLYAAGMVLVRSMGTVLVVHLLQRCVSDSAIAAFSLLSGIAGYYTHGVATNSKDLFVSLALSFASNAIQPLCCAILSKMADQNQQGALFASLAVVETLCDLASNFLYSALYKITVSHMNGAVFLFMAGLDTLTLGLMLLYFCLSSRRGPGGQSEG